MTESPYSAEPASAPATRSTRRVDLDRPSDDLTAAAADALGALVALHRSAAQPVDARHACRQLEARHPGVAMVLVAQRERWSRAHHYELVVGQPAVGAVTLAYCADRGVPWLTRDASRLDDDVVARVDGVPIRVAEAIELCELTHDAGLADRIITALVIRAGLERHGLADAPVDDSALQHALNDFRVARGLHHVAATEGWLDARGLTLAVLERSLEDQVRARELRDRVTAGELDDYFAAHRADFDRVVAGVARFARADDARELANRTDAEPIHDLVAHRALDYRVERWRRGACPDDLREALFDEPAGAWRARGDRLVRAITCTPATELDEPTRRDVRDHLFDGWLAERRAEARIEWCR